MQLPGLRQFFQRLSIKRQTLIQSVAMMMFACLLLSLSAAAMMQRHLESALLTTAKEEAGNRLELVETHLRNLEEEVLRIARNTAQLRRHKMELSLHHLRSALIIDFMMHRESRGLTFTDAKGQPTHAVSSDMRNLNPKDVQHVLSTGQILRNFQLESAAYTLIVPIKDGEQTIGTVAARFDFKVVLQNFFQRKNQLLYSFELNGQAFFQTQNMATGTGAFLRTESGILHELGMACRYLPYDHNFKRPLHETLILLLIISLALIMLTIGISLRLGHQLSEPALELYQKFIQPEDEFVQRTNNELINLSEALAFYQDKTQAMLRELEKNRDEALKATQTKSEFLANMSHEIRTPMNGVLGMAQLIRFTEMTPEQRKYVDAIIDAGDTLMGLINDILDFSKIEAGQFQIDFQDFDLKRCLQATVQIFEVKAKEKGLQILLDMKDDLPRMIRGDDLRLKQILNNLISNAIKFTSKGHVSIYVTAQEQPDQRINLRISVQDTGIGIHKDDLSKLFKSFSQANSSIARKFGGTGLGLAISQALCEMMGGSIGVESSVGKGSTFYFNLIFEPAQTQTSEPTQQRDEYSRNLRILVADDSDVNQMIIRTMFKKLGIRVDMASDGLEAIEMAAGTAYDLIYMDVHMPLKEGPDAARTILVENRFQPPPKIIALTADMFKDDHRKCFESGMIDLLIKPIQLNDLRLSLLKYGNRARSDRDPISQAS